MNNQQKSIAVAVGAIISLAGMTAHAADVKCTEQERCYGVVKAGKNDCSTSTSACSGTAKQDFQKDAWIYVPKGTCAKLAGSTIPVTDSGKKK